MPCGECDIGCYTERAFLNRKARIFGAIDEAQRLSHVPRCKTFDRPCQGAVEFHEWLVEIDKP